MDGRMGLIEMPQPLKGLYCPKPLLFSPKSDVMKNTG